MFIVKLIRFFKGYVYFSAYNGHIERLLNLISNNQIAIWDMSKKEEILKGYVTIKHYKIIKKLSKKTGVTTKVLEKFGFPFFVRKYRKRIGLLIGLALIILFLFIMQQFIWVIEIEGLENLPKEKIVETAEKYGLRKGAYIKNVDFKSVKQKIIADIPELSWLTVNNHGSKIVIELREAVLAPDIISKDTASNIIASSSGQIKRMEVYQGQKLVEIDDVVEQGDLLVSGIIEDDKGNRTFTNSRGKIFAHISETKEFSTKFNYENVTPTGKNIKRNYLDIFGIKIPLFIATNLKGEYEKETEYQDLYLFKTKLPLGLYKMEYKEVTRENIILDEMSAKEKLQKEIEEYEQSLGDVKIVSKEIIETKQSDSLALSVIYTFEKDIAIAQEILKEN